MSEIPSITPPTARALPAAAADAGLPDLAAALRPPAWTAAPRAAWPLVAGLLVAAGLFTLVQQRVVGGFANNLMVLAGINIILACSLNIVNGYAGQFSIGHAGFMALGGYAAAALTYYGSVKWFGDASFHGGLVSWTGRPGRFNGPLLAPGDLLLLGSCLLGGLVAACAGWLVGLPSLRLRGDYLAIVTLGFGEIVRVVLQGSEDQAVGPRNVGPLSWWELAPRLGSARGFNFIPTYTTVFWVYAWVAVMLAVAIRLKYSSYGRALLSIREDEVAARAVGVNVTKYKVRAFVLAAFFAGVAGALAALQLGTINAGDFGFQRSFEVVIMVVLGGLGSVSGTAIAAVLLTVLPEVLRQPPSLLPWGLVGAAVLAVTIWFRARRPWRGLIALAVVCVGYELARWLAGRFGVQLSDYRMVIYALLLIVMMIVRPQGLLGVRELWDVLAPRRRRRPAASQGHRAEGASA